MSFISRCKSFFGVGEPITTIASAATLVVPPNVSTFFVSGTTAITSISTAKIPGRQLNIIGVTATGPAFTNTDDTTTEGAMDLGGSNRTLAPSDVMQIIQRNDGSWLMLNITDN